MWKRNRISVSWMVSFQFCKSTKTALCRMEITHYFPKPEWYVNVMWPRHFVIMTTWSCQLGRYISIGIVEAERAVTVQIMKNGRSLMLACFFTVAGTFGERMEDMGSMYGMRECENGERDVWDARVFAFLFLPQTAATSTICASKCYKHPTMRQYHFFQIQTNISSQTFNAPTRCWC